MPLLHYAVRTVITRRGRYQLTLPVKPTVAEVVFGRTATKIIERKVINLRMGLHIDLEALKVLAPIHTRVREVLVGILTATNELVEVRQVVRMSCHGATTVPKHEQHEAAGC